MIEALKQTIAAQIAIARTSLKDLEECIDVGMFSEKGLGIISKNMEDTISQISDIGWLTTLKKE